MRSRVVRFSVLLPLLAACGSAPVGVAEPPPVRSSKPTSSATLVARLLSGDAAERVDAECRLVARGPVVAPALRREIAAANEVERWRLLGVLEDLDRLPDEISDADRAGLLLWRLRGGNGSETERSRAVLRLRTVPAPVRDALTRSAREPGPDRVVALFALSRTGDRASVPVLAEALDAEDRQTREAAGEGLRSLTGIDWSKVSAAERARRIQEWSTKEQG